MTEIRGKDTIGGVRYDASTSEVMTRCSSCNIYRKREDFASSLFRICRLCQSESRDAKDAKDANRDKRDIYSGIHDYFHVGKRRDIELVLWRFLKPAVLVKSKVALGAIGRPNIQHIKKRVLSEVITKRKAIPKKYRPALLQLIADNSLPPEQLLWLIFRPGLLDDKILRLAAIDTAREVVRSSDLQDIIDVSYFYDDAEYITRHPDSAVASAKAQKDLRLRVASVAKQLSKHRKVLQSTWWAYDALLCAIHPGAKKAAESTAFHYVQIQCHVWEWKTGRALLKLLDIYTRRLETNLGVSSSASKAELRTQVETKPDVVNSTQDSKKPLRYYISCNAIYSSDRYLVETGSDDKEVELVVFYNATNKLELGRTFRVPKTQLTPGPDGFVEISKEELVASGIKLP